VITHFGNSARESTTSSMSSMKGGNSDNNGSDLNKNNILKPTFDILTEEGQKAFEAYRTDFEELFLLRGEVMREGTVLWDTTLIIFNKPEVRPDPSPSHNDVQSMINSALERQAKSTDELLHRLIEERDSKKLEATSINTSSSTCAVSFTQTNLHISGASAGGTSMPNHSAQPMNHLHSRTTNEGSAPTFGCHNKLRLACLGKSIHKPHLVFLYKTSPQPHTPPGAMAELTRTLATTTKSHIPP
jgi:hypothetical protein